MSKYVYILPPVYNAGFLLKKSNFQAQSETTPGDIIKVVFSKFGKLKGWSVFVIIMEHNWHWLLLTFFLIDHMPIFQWLIFYSKNEQLLNGYISIVNKKNYISSVFPATLKTNRTITPEPYMDFASCTPSINNIRDSSIIHFSATDPSNRNYSRVSEGCLSANGLCTSLKVITCCSTFNLDRKSLNCMTKSEFNV